MTAKKAETPVATDIDGDGKLDLDPAKVEETLFDLVTLDHALKEEGSSLAQLLRHYAASTRGINC